MKRVSGMILIAVLALMPGCSLIQSDQVKQVSSVVINGPILINDVEGVYDDLAKLQEEKGIFSDEELEVLEDSMTVYEVLKAEYEALTSLEIMPSADEATVMWNQAIGAYSASMEIVNSKRSEYSSKTIIKIDVMDAHAKRANKDITALLADPTARNVTDALKIIGGLAKIGLKMSVLI